MGTSGRRSSAGAESLGPLDPKLQSTVVLATYHARQPSPLVLRDRVHRKATPREWGGVAWLGVADALNVLLFFGAYHLTTVGIAVTTHYLTPLFVALAAPWVLGEALNKRTYFAAGSCP